MKRKSNPPKVLEAENGAITQFMFDAVEPLSPDQVHQTIPLQEVFDAYQTWRSRNKLPPTVLTVDGFGRMFPQAYPRRSVYWAPVKHALKCLAGIGLRRG